ncbi:Synergin gamma [Sarcoptes scabiei]|nr:Synergin gamma [Sarcoptes scabiei]
MEQFNDEIKINDDDPEESAKKIKKNSIYRQQQQRLQQITLASGTKIAHSSSNHGHGELSADNLIKNILEKVNTEAKISKYYGQKNSIGSFSTTNTLNSCLATQDFSSQPSPRLIVPKCFRDQPKIPEIYLKIWERVKNPDRNEFCLRDELYRILIKSSLPKEYLAKFWSFVNRTKPGELTRDELFVILALIGLCQEKPNIFNPIDEIYRVQSIPKPKFDIIYEQDPEFLKIDKYKSFEAIKDDNDFCDFQSALNWENGSNAANHLDSIALNLNRSDKLTLSKPSADSTLESSMNFANSSSKNEKEFADFRLLCDTNCAERNSNLSSNEFDIKNSENLEIVKNLGVESDEFGDFISQPITNNEIVLEAITSRADKLHLDPSNTSIDIKRKMLKAIKQTMHKSFNILIVNYDQDSVAEALHSEQGIMFAKDLYETFRICRRIQSNIVCSKELESDLECQSFLNDIYTNWNAINNLFNKSLSQKIFSEDEIHHDDDFKKFQENDSDKKVFTSNRKDPICFICSTPFSSENRLRDSRMTLLNDHYYHISCANFWLHHVEGSCLPRANCINNSLNHIQNDYLAQFDKISSESSNGSRTKLFDNGTVEKTDVNELLA